MKTINFNKISRPQHKSLRMVNYALCIAMAVTAASCKDNDDLSVVPAATVPSSITFNLPDNLKQLIYIDATGAQVLPMVKGESITLDYTLLPDTATFKDVVWTSTNKDVASVDDKGVVNALSGDGAGYSMVQVSPEGLYSGSGINATLKIAVSNEMVKATAINIVSSADDVYGGDTLHLSTVITPSNSTYKTVKWSCSDKSAATIDMYGVLTAKTTSAAKTPVTITATALDGSGIAATKVINIRQIIQPQDITLAQTYSSDKGYDCAINEKSVTLSYTTLPAECTTSLIQWTSSDENIATVKDGVVTFNQSGNFGAVTITATCPQTGKSSSIKLNIPAGLIRETFHNQNQYSWYNAKQSGNGTSSSHVWHDGYITITTYKANATTERADIKCWDAHTWFHVGNYPIFAIRMNDVKGIDGITSRNINLDAVGTSASGTAYKAIANGNNKYLYDYKCSDGSHVFIYDLSTQACGTGGLMPTNETVDFTTLQIKYADMKTVDHQISYNFYWIQTFKSLSDVQKYIKSEGLTYE